MAFDFALIAPHDEPALWAWFAVEAAAHAVDHPDDPPPCWAEHRVQLATPWPGEDTTAWLARRDGEPVGAAMLCLPVRDNRDNALVDLVVHPPHRRRGVGRALLAVVSERARAAGRVRLIGEARSPMDVPSAGTAFAEAVGAKDAQVEVQRRLDLPSPDEAACATDGTSGPAGYRLVQWSGSTPDGWLGDIARLEARMSTDAPLGDLHWEPEVHDAGRVRERDEMCRARGITLLTSAAVGPDGRLAAYTELGLNASVDWHAYTWNTLVVPEHRGHGLGMWVKRANLAMLRERHPSVRRVSTWNAASNRHMIAINEALGFRTHDAMHEFELTL